MHRANCFDELKSCKKRAARIEGYEVILAICRDLRGVHDVLRELPNPAAELVDRSLGSVLLKALLRAVQEPLRPPDLRDEMPKDTSE